MSGNVIGVRWSIYSIFKLVISFLVMIDCSRCDLLSLIVFKNI